MIEKEKSKAERLVSEMKEKQKCQLGQMKELYEKKIEDNLQRLDLLLKEKNGAQEELQRFIAEEKKMKKMEVSQQDGYKQKMKN